MDSEQAYRVRVVLREESLADREGLQEMLEDFEAMTREAPYEVSFKTALEVTIEAEEISRPPIDSGYLGLYCEQV